MFHRRPTNNRKANVSSTKALRQEMNPFSHLLRHTTVDQIAPPSEMLSLRAMRWIRFAVSPPASGQWTVSTDPVVKAALTGAGTSSSLIVNRIRLYCPDTTGAFQIQLNERPDIIGTSGPLTRYTSRGITGASSAVMEIGMGRFWKEYPLQLADNGGLLFIVNLPAVGTTPSVNIICDVLVEVTINLTNFTEQVNCSASPVAGSNTFESGRCTPCGMLPFTHV